MRTRVDIVVGKTYGGATVLWKEPAGYACRCRCGNEMLRTKRQLLQNTEHCRRCRPGHAGNPREPSKLEPRSKHGRLTLIKELEQTRHGHRVWLCQCSCGKQSTPLEGAIVSGAVQSCGCRRKEKLARMGIGVPSPEERRRGKHQSMHKCNACNETFNHLTEGLVTTSGTAVVASVCGACCKDVRVAKLVLRKPDVGRFEYEQWSPMEMATSGLSSTKRVG